MATIHLIGVGRVLAVPASELVVGDRLMWNYGSVYTVVSIEDVSPKFLAITERDKDGKVWPARRFKKDRLLARMAKAAEKQPERVSVSTPEIKPGDVVLSHGMRVLIEGPAHVYHGGCDHPLALVPAGRTDVREPALIDGEACRIVYAWPGKVLNVPEVLEQGIVPRGFLFDDQRRNDGPGHGREDYWTIQGNSLARWTVLRSA